MRLLLVEDDPGVRRSLQLLLQANGFDVRAYASGAALLADQTALDASCLIADYRMSDFDGVDTLTALRAKGWAGPAILITAFPSSDLCASAKDAGFEEIFEKPLRRHVLVKAVERLVRPAARG
ncbi:MULTISPECIES: response regulator transcription factor [unclassified Sphingomonas]|uniref:response regulator transcription factor n=1 Tax=unclassified Sphingomonas TaxID=196159 RepID=UPI002AA2ABFA|nr:MULTISPECIES: response regulator [unclassified Sphingomonas]